MGEETVRQQIKVSIIHSLFLIYVNFALKWVSLIMLIIVLLTHNWLPVSNLLSRFLMNWIIAQICTACCFFGGYWLGKKRVMSSLTPHSISWRKSVISSAIFLIPGLVIGILVANVIGLLIAQAPIDFWPAVAEGVIIGGVCISVYFMFDLMIEEDKTLLFFL